MIPEQVWDADDLPDGSMKRGMPTGAAMPLCWSHAEYISLVRSRHDGVCFDRVEPAYQRYVAKPVGSGYEIWTQRHALRWVQRGKILRIILQFDSIIAWSIDDWGQRKETETVREENLGLWYADFPTEGWQRDTKFGFTIFWRNEQRWEGRNWHVDIL